MNGVEFEHYVASLLKTNGYSRVKCTQTANDYGADIIAYRKGEKIALQCKRYNGSVGVAAVQEVLGAKSYYKAQKAIVVTNSKFTVNAIRLAKESNVTMWDRSNLMKLMGAGSGHDSSGSAADQLRTGGKGRGSRKRRLGFRDNKIVRIGIRENQKWTDSRNGKQTETQRKSNRRAKLDYPHVF